MKVLYIHHGSARGGAPLSLAQLLRELPRDINPVICSAMEDAEVTSFFASEGYDTCSCRLKMFDHTTLGYYSLKSFSDINKLLRWCKSYSDACKNLEKLLLSLKPDLVHLNSLTLTPYACVPARLGIPTVVHVREPVLNGIFGFRKAWLRRLLNLYASEVICICKDNLDRLGLRKDLGTVVYNPVNFQQFDFQISKETARIRPELPTINPVILYAGGTSTVKGPDLFLEAIRIVANKFPGIRCLMPSFTRPIHFGRTPFRRVLCRHFFKAHEKYANCADFMYENEIIQAPEFRFDIQTCIAAADVVCVPHALPHFSRVLMEAGAMKKPVVAFGVGGVLEVVQDGVTGLLAGPRNVSQLAECIIRILENPDTAITLGEGGYRQAVNIFHSKISAAFISDIYNRVLHKNE